MILLKFILFADDTTIVAHINTNNMETANIINIKLEKILHISKTKLCIFHKVQREVSIPEIQIGNTFISNTKVEDFFRI